MAEYSKSHYSPRLKTIIVSAGTNSLTTQHIQECSVTTAKRDFMLVIV